MESPSVVIVRKCAVDGDPAHVICVSCDDPVCDVCIGRREGDRVVCRRCAYTEALKGTVERAEEKRVDAVATAARRDPTKVSRRRARTAVAALVGAVVTLSVSVVPDTVSALADPSPFAYGDADPGDGPGLSRVLAGLWQVRSAMDTWAAAHSGVPPRDLGALTDAPARCPGCGGAWDYVVRGRGWEVACPNPGVHARGRVILDSRFGPPIATSPSATGRK